MATILEQIPTGTIRGRYLLVSQDNIDEGTDPNLTVVSGSIVFTPSFSGTMQTANQELGFLPRAFEAEFDSEGYLIPKGSGAEVVAGKLERGIKLLATNSNFFNPRDFTYTVTFNIIDLETGSRITIPPFSIAVPADTIQYLPSITPVGSSNGALITRGVPGESVYQMAVRLGFNGTEQQFMNTVYGSGSGGFDPELIRDTIATTIQANAPLTFTHNDAIDKMIFGTTATQNQTDAYLLNRANHTGSQPASTISDFNEAVQDAVAQLLQQGSGVTLNYNDEANTLTITAPNNGTGTPMDAEAIRDIMGVAMIGLGNINILVNDAADTITFTTTATQNASDSALRSRNTHTGEQPISSVTNLQATLDNLASNAGGNTRAIVYNFTSASWPTRNTVTTNPAHIVTWYGPTFPPVTTGYALKGDDWRKRTS